MTGMGWELWGLKFSWAFVTLMSGILFIYTWLKGHSGSTMMHVDRMAGDEGDD